VGFGVDTPFGGGIYYVHHLPAKLIPQLEIIGFAPLPVSPHHGKLSRCGKSGILSVPSADLPSNTIAGNNRSIILREFLNE
jgi:hypothetical protein